MSTKIDKPQTAPPTNRYGERLSRFLEHWDEPGAVCQDCGSQGLDLWITEGATDCIGVCPECRHQHTRDWVRRAV